jgi:hypothetical protein
MSESPISKGTGIIPDFFHDIIAYIIPGYVAIIAIIINVIIITNQGIDLLDKVNLTSISILFLIAYVIGRFFEQLGLKTIHNRKFPFVGKKQKTESPKWTLLFKDDIYSSEFKKSLLSKITEWCEKTLGSDFMSKCESEKKDDYFNLIQFYLRERYPAVAFYEKKQNATIVLTRSLTIIFFVNALLIYPILLVYFSKLENVEFSGLGLIWILGALAFSFVFYSRFKQDQKYHAMYIFENFIGLKKTLKAKK